MAEGSGASKEQTQADENESEKLVFRAGILDCKSKLHFCAAKSLKRNQEFFRCANYKDGRGSCTIHFIRDVLLEMIVKEAVAGLADFVRCYYLVFLYLMKNNCG